MGFDCTYQGVLKNHSAIKQAKEDDEFAENVFYHFIAFQTLDEQDKYDEDESYDRLIKALDVKNPEMKEYVYKPISRKQDALVYLLDPLAYGKAQSYEELEKLFSYKLVMGEKEFSQNLRAGQGLPVRVSSADFIVECVEFLTHIDRDLLISNFNPEEMVKYGVYKIGLSSGYKWIMVYVEELLEFYKKIVEHGDMLVFIIED